jgi:hypothetical protein
LGEKAAVRASGTFKLATMDLKEEVSAKEVGRGGKREGLG